ncbi:MAG: amidohydrolase family protein [Candidatus Schekmanbacteria bacterium]|nr:amidohydrolase family protein [Candidatus Schekmanbacteria bacterium]
MILSAPYILPVDSPPILDGAIVIEGGRIVAKGGRGKIREDFPGHPVRNLPRHILMPGLVNCHAHLELSALRGKIPVGQPFTEWLKQVVTLRSAWQSEDYRLSIGQGIAQLIAAGITCVADITATGLSLLLLEESGLRGIVFLEIIGFQHDLAQEKAGHLKSHLIRLSAQNGRFALGVAPHAPYSVSPDLFRQLGKLLGGYKLSVHLAESREEVNFLADGFGAFREFLKWRGVWDDAWQAPGCSPVNYLKNLHLLVPDALLVHLNYLDKADYAVLLQSKIHLVTCPASNRRLGHSNLHLQTLYRNGVNVVLGTDSLASNDELNLFREMRLLSYENPWLSFAEVIKIATLHGAKALGLEAETGSLTCGKYADIIAIAAPDHLAQDRIEEYIVNEALNPELVLIDGKVAVGGL